MAENTQTSGEVFPSDLARAAEEAARKGQSVGEYLNAALVGALTRGAASEIATASKTSAAQRRLDAVRRRLDAATDGLDGAIDALDSALGELSGRIAGAEALGGHAAVAAAELAADLRSFRSRLDTVACGAERDAKQNQSEHAELAAALVMLCRRLDALEADVQKASEHADVSAEAQNALKQAVAEDFRSFAHDTAAKLNTGLEDVRAAADKAARQAEAAAANVVNELRRVRETLEARLAQNAAEARAKVQSAFAENAERITALGARLEASDRAQKRLAEDLRRQVMHVEQGAQAALERTALTLQDQLAQSQEESRQAIAALQNDAAQIRQAAPASSTSLQAIEAEIDALKRSLALAAVDSRGRDAKAEDEWEARFEELALRFQRDAERNAEEHIKLRSESERIEACTMAALEKLSGDITAGDIALEARLQRAMRLTDESIAQLRTNLEEKTKELQRQHETAAERVDRLTSALSVLQADSAPLHARITRMERLEARAEAEQAAIIALAQRMSDLEQRQSKTFEELRAQIADFIAKNDERLAELEEGETFDAETLSSQFSDLRIRIEERIAAVEQRSVRMLEQVADTVLMLDKRLSGASAAEPPESSAKIA